MKFDVHRTPGSVHIDSRGEYTFPRETLSVFLIILHQVELVENWCCVNSVLNCPMIRS